MRALTPAEYHELELLAGDGPDELAEPGERGVLVDLERAGWARLDPNDVPRSKGTWNITDRGQVARRAHRAFLSSQVCR